MSDRNQGGLGGEAIPAFACFSSVFAHDEDCAPGMDWLTFTKPMRGSRDYTNTEARFMFSVTQSYYLLYMGANAPTADETLPVFDSKLRWSTPTTGERDRIDSSLQRSIIFFRTYHTSRLPAGGDLARLSMDVEMVTAR